MKLFILNFLILFLILAGTKISGQGIQDLCHFSNYQNKIFPLIYENDIEKISIEIKKNKKIIISPFGSLDITPFSYSILLNKNSITESMFNKLKRRKRKSKTFADTHIKMAVLSGNAFALKKILYKSKINSLEPYNKNLTDFLIKYELSEKFPGEKSICFKTISKSSILELVEFYFKKANTEERTNLSHVLIKKCSKYLAKNESKLLEYIVVTEDNLIQATEGLISTMEDDYEKGFTSYATILLGMLKSCTDENMFNAVYIDLLTYCVQSENQDKYKKLEELGIFELLRSRKRN